MKKLSLLILLLLLPSLAHAVAYTAVASGSWTSEATWGNQGGYPTATDTFTINKGVSVILSQNITVAGGTIGANAGGSTGIAILAVTNYATLTVTGALKVGQGTQYDDGSLSLEHGSNLSIGGNMELNNGQFISTTGGAGWSTVTGTGAITSNYATAASPRQNINLSYVSFQNTGTFTGRAGTQGAHHILFVAAGINGGAQVPNQIILSHCVFAGGSGSSAVYLGLATPASAAHTVDNCDFRDVHVVLSGTGGTSTGGFWVKGSTFVATAATTCKAFCPQGTKTGLIVSGNFFNGYATTASVWSTTIKGSTWQNNAFTGSTSLNQATGLFNIVQDGAAHTFQNNYIYANWYNAHLMSVSGTGGTTGTKISSNIWESYWELDTGDNVNFIFFNSAGVAGMEVSHNILIGKGNLVGYIASSALGTGNTILVRNNTTYTNTANSNLATLWQNEGTNAYWLGTLIFQNNLHQGFSNATPIVSSCFPQGQTQAATARGNVYLGAGAGYGNFTLTNQVPNDITSASLVSPNATFVDATRAFITWTAGGAFTASTKTGTTDATDGSANAKAYLAMLNGYDSATKTQNIANASAQGPADLVTWVRSGFAPQLGTLYNTGYNDGVNTTNIGAVDPVDLTAPTISTFTIATPATDVYTVTLTIADSDNFAVTGWWLSETNTTPGVNDVGWLTSRPANYTFATPQNSGTTSKTLYLWAKDAAGNMSTPVKSASVNITKSATVGDTTAPVVTVSIPATSQTTDNVAVTLTASDKIDNNTNGVLTAYCLSDVSADSAVCATAGVGTSGWIPVTQQATYSGTVTHTFAASGVRTLRAWFKDNATPNIGMATATINITSLTTVYDLEQLKAAILDSQLIEEYAAQGQPATLRQLLYMIWSMLSGKSVTGTNLYSYKLDATTPAMHFQIDNANNPKSIQRVQ